MTATLKPTTPRPKLEQQKRAGDPPGPRSSGHGVPWRKRPLWHRFTPWQLLIMTLAAVPVGVIVGAVTAGLTGIISTEEMTEVALAAGENPGMITFGAMFLASPVQWFTGRTQLRVRKYLGVVFYLLAISNGAMFVVESGAAQSLSRPFLVAGSVALVAAFPLFMTSSRWSQRKLGMPRWRQLHKLTYVVAIALVSHVLLIGDVGLGFILIVTGFIARIPAIRRSLVRRGAK